MPAHPYQRIPKEGDENDLVELHALGAAEAAASQPEQPARGDAPDAPCSGTDLEANRPGRDNTTARTTNTDADGLTAYYNSPRGSGCDPRTYLCVLCALTLGVFGGLAVVSLKIGIAQRIQREKNDANLQVIADAARAHVCVHSSNGGGGGDSEAPTSIEVDGKVYYAAWCPDEPTGTLPQHSTIIITHSEPTDTTVSTIPLDGDTEFGEGLPEVGGSERDTVI